MAKQTIKEGDIVAIEFPSPPDEWGTVEVIYRADRNYHRRALVRFVDGTSTTVPMDRLRIIEDPRIRTDD